MEKKRIALVGSTGSIGTQALDVIRRHPAHFTAEILTAQNNADLLIQQAIEFQPNMVVIGNETAYTKVKDALASYPIKVFAGKSSLAQVCESSSVDLVLAAIVGFAGLDSTLNAIRAGKPVALANKETMVVAGHLITRLAQENAVNIYPVDSEHSAIFQCLAGEFHNPLEKIILTASGGPFRGYGQAELEQVSPAAALQHPNWKMGAKITIDSASLMNKGLEVIEARWLFNLKPEQIEVIVHPQSIVHSLVQFRDGSLKAQLGLPDMRLPIQYAFGYPERLATDYPRFSFTDYPTLTFEQPHPGLRPNLDLAYTALQSGGNMACILNAANEMAVDAFLKNHCSFTGMYDLLVHCMQTVAHLSDPGIEELQQTDEITRIRANEYIHRKK